MPSVQAMLDSASSPAEAAELLERLFAQLAFVAIARPLFCVLGSDLNELAWSAGGTDVHDMLGTPKPTTLDALLVRLGIDGGQGSTIRERMRALAPGEQSLFAERLMGREGRAFSMVFRRRMSEDGASVQFTINDTTRFVEAERRTQELAAQVTGLLQEPDEEGRSVRRRLDAVETDFYRLCSLGSDDEVRALAQSMTRVVEKATWRAVEILHRFEQLEYAHAPVEPATLPPPKPVVADWGALRSRIEQLVAGQETLSEMEGMHLGFANSFARYAIPLMILADGRGGAMVLNGSHGGERHATVDALVRGLGVEENSRRTATDFFEDLACRSGHSVFAMENRNVEAWGQPLADGGWQAVIAPASTETVDVRGLFHGFKNLLLHLQVLYVVHTLADVNEVRAGIADTFARIEMRLATLRGIALGSQLVLERHPETVAQWLAPAREVGYEFGRAVEVSIENGLEHVAYRAVPGEMEDALAEMVRNAFQHGAQRVTVEARCHGGDHLEIVITDNGRGMSEEKLSQLRTTLDTHHYDPTLSTREGGTGNGLLGAQSAIRRFVDGALRVEHGPDGGVRLTVAMKLPSATS